MLAQAQDSSEVLGVDFRLNEARNTEMYSNGVWMIILAMEVVMVVAALACR